MKPILKMAVFAFLLVLLIPLLLLFLNKRKTKRLDPHYAEPSGKVHSGKYVLEELSIPGKMFTLQTADPAKDPLYEPVTMSYLGYDTLKHQIILISEEYVPGKAGPPSLDKLIHISYFSMDGQLINHKSERYGVKDAGLENTVLLKEATLPFQKWKDDQQEIFLKHFAIQKFDPGCLNPISFATPNGGSPCYIWSGMGYYDLKIGTDTLKFKLPVRKSDLFFTEKHAYNTNLRFYKLPASPKLTAPAFLLYLAPDEKHRIFILKKLTH